MENIEQLANIALNSKVTLFLLLGIVFGFEMLKRITRNIINKEWPKLTKKCCIAFLAFSSAYMVQNTWPMRLIYGWFLFSISGVCFAKIKEVWENALQKVFAPLPGNK